MSSLLPIVKLNNVQGKVARNRYLSTHLIIFKAKWRFLQLGGHYPMLRHACGFALADQGAGTRLIQDYLGHRNIQHTVIYTAANPARFEKLWR